MENDVSHAIIGAAIEVHKVLGGPGLLESVYESCLYHELVMRGLKVERQVSMPVRYKGSLVKDQLCINLLVEGMIIIEVKSTEKPHPLHEAQLLTYLRVAGKKLGLVVNFGQEHLKNGITRVVNGL